MIDSPVNIKSKGKNSVIIISCIHDTHLSYVQSDDITTAKNDRPEKSALTSFARFSSFDICPAIPLFESNVAVKNCSSSRCRV